MSLVTKSLSLVEWVDPRAVDGVGTETGGVVCVVARDVAVSGWRLCLVVFGNRLGTGVTSHPLNDVTNA